MDQGDSISIEPERSSFDAAVVCEGLRNLKHALEDIYRTRRVCDHYFEDSFDLAAHLALQLNLKPTTVVPHTQAEMTYENRNYW